MNKEKGSSTIAIIAIVAVALLIGIWVGAKKDIVISEINDASASLKKVNKVEKNIKPEMKKVEKEVAVVKNNIAE